MNLSQQTLLRMLEYRRPAWSSTEEEFITRFIDPVPGIYSDWYGNRILTHPTSRVMISCHTDTVHKSAGHQRVKHRKGIAKLSRFESESNCLGADDTAGIYAALRMIEAGVPATFVFHRAEEIGGRGSSWLADHYADWLREFDICLALDRRGTQDIIIEQWRGETASVEFALSLADQLGMSHRPADGLFTDSANYARLIPECSNISVGYYNEHSRDERLDTVYLENLIQSLCNVDWDCVMVERDPTVEYVNPWLVPQTFRAPKSNDFFIDGIVLDDMADEYDTTNPWD